MRRQNRFFGAVLNRDGDIRIAPKAVGDYVLEFLQDQTKCHDLKSKAYLLEPVHCEEE